MSDSYNDSGGSQNLTPKLAHKRAARTNGFVVDKRVVIALMVTAVITVLASVVYSTGKFGKQSRTASGRGCVSARKAQRQKTARISPARISPARHPSKLSPARRRRAENAGDLASAQSLIRNLNTHIHSVLFKVKCRFLVVQERATMCTTSL